MKRYSSISICPKCKNEIKNKKLSCSRCVEMLKSLEKYREISLAWTHTMHPEFEMIGGHKFYPSSDYKKFEE